MNNEQWEDAIEALSKALSLEPNSAIGWHNCAICYFLLENFEAALVAADQALALDPTLEDDTLDWIDIVRQAMLGFDDDFDIESDAG
jgi:tetratricopeptide (TPR) repeat protein